MKPLQSLKFCLAFCNALINLSVFPIVPCAPGSYSVTGVEPCLPCAKGFYQPKTEQTACLRCPNRKSTYGRGAASISQCTGKPSYAVQWLSTSNFSLRCWYKMNWLHVRIKELIVYCKLCKMKCKILQTIYKKCLEIRSAKVKYLQTPVQTFGKLTPWIF